MLEARVHRTIATLLRRPARMGVDVREMSVTRLTEARGELAIDWWTEGAGCAR
jgi:hypothetical protein